jgi:hypothetical protein
MLVVFGIEPVIVSSHRFRSKLPSYNHPNLLPMPLRAMGEYKAKLLP